MGGRSRRSLGPGTWLTVAALVLLLAVVPPGAGAEARTAAGDTPVLAYYYIWFNATSWGRAKSDYPALGRYSSGESRVMSQHVRWAKEAGIDGFIVSWKSTEDLNSRLERLIAIAEEEDFGLSLIYQGLDFERRPLPAERVAADLELFAQRYAERPPFRLFPKPLVVWSGTWNFTPEEVASVTGRVRDRLLLLASERNVEGFSRLANAVDGNAYYWSSVNPQTHRRYDEKLRSLAGAVHSQGGLWIAPAAPGFDARLIGGRSVVERQGGETLRRQWKAANASQPDAIGLISWNEFSENSHLEPSRKYGNHYLRLVQELVTGDFAGLPDDGADSSGSRGRPSGSGRFVLLAGMGAFLLACGAIIVLRERRARRQPR